MKTALAFVCVLGLVASAAVADIFNTTRDNSVLGHSQERTINCGASSNNRIAKNTQHMMIMDFDTDAMKAFEVANPLAVGEYYKYELFLSVYSGWAVTPAAVNIRTLNSASEWAEGDGNWADLDWTPGTPASIYGYAQAYWQVNDNGTTTCTGDDYKEVDPALSIKWQDETSGSDVSNLPGLAHNYQNNLDFVASSADHDNYVGVVLDDDADPMNLNLLVDDLLNNTLNRGLRTWKDAYGNEKVAFREQSGGARTPYIEVTVVPEPFSLALLGLGGLGLLIRRKRR